MTAFLEALDSGSLDRLSALLTESVQFQSDGGGQATALRRILHGQSDVSAYLIKILARLWTGGRMDRCHINGVEGLVFYDQDRLVTAATFGFSQDGRIDQIYIIRNPQKLGRMDEVVRHDPSSGNLWPR